MSEVGFVHLDDAFEHLVGKKASLRRLCVSDQQTFHEAGIYLPARNKVYLSSNRLRCSDYGQRAVIVAIGLDSIPDAAGEGILSPLESWNGYQVIETLPSHLAMPNGGTVWDDDSVLWCEQGRDSKLDKVPSSLIIHNVRKNTTAVALSQYQDLPFSSLNDVVLHPDTGSVFFTDPDYGVEQSFKSGNTSYAPNALYVWQPTTNALQMLDDKYVKPNGVTFSQSSNGGGVLYTTDTGRFRFHRNDDMGDFHEDANGPACIYSYQVAAGKDADGLPNIDIGSRKLFAESTSGVPDGIHIDTRGNVWAGHGDGVHVYQPQSDGTGKLIGKIVLPSGNGVANFCWAGSCGDAQYRLLVFAETELWEVMIDVDGRD